MYLVFFPINNPTLTHPDNMFSTFDLTNVEESKKAMQILLALFPNDLHIYDISSTRQKSRFSNLHNLTHDLNHEELDTENNWCISLNLSEKDMDELTLVAATDFVIIENKTKKPLKYHGDDNEMICYGDYESAWDDTNSSDMLLSLLTYNTDVEGVQEVHVFELKQNDVKEIASFEVMAEDWIEETHKNLIKLFNKPMNKIYLTQCNYGDGEHFSLDIANACFATKEAAIADLKKTAKDVKKEFVEHFGTEGLSVEEFEERITIDYNQFSDWWEGKVIELNVES